MLRGLAMRSMPKSANLPWRDDRLRGFAESRFYRSTKFLVVQNRRDLPSYDNNFPKEGLIESNTVTPAQAGVHEFQWFIDSHLRGNDINQRFPKDIADASDLPTAAPLTNIRPIDPLVLDLDGDGVELVSLDDSTVLFDMNVDGFAERTGWVNQDDGLLVIDTNGNDRIDDGSELFDDQAGFAHGFAQLAALDSNQDVFLK